MMACIDVDQADCLSLVKKTRNRQVSIPHPVTALFLLVGFHHKSYGNKEGRLEGWVSLGELGGRLCAWRVVQRWRLVHRFLLSVRRRGKGCRCSSQPFHV